MALDLSKWRVLADTDVLSIFSYETADSVTTADYFAPLWDTFKISDLIFVDSGGATTLYRVAARDVNTVTIAAV